MQSHTSTCIKESFCLSSPGTYANIFQVEWALLPPLIHRAGREGGLSRGRIFEFQSSGVISCPPRESSAAGRLELLHLLLFHQHPAAGEEMEKSLPARLEGSAGFLRLFKVGSRPLPKPGEQELVKVQEFTCLQSLGLILNRSAGKYFIIF